MHFNIIENSKVLEAAEAVGKTSNIDFSEFQLVSHCFHTEKVPCI